MPTFAPIQTSFAAGETSPRMRGRVDTKAYQQALAECTNWNPTPQGSLLKCEGVELVSPKTTVAGFIRSLDFKSSALKTYQVMLSDQRLEIFTPGGLHMAFATELVVNSGCDTNAGGWTLVDAAYAGNAPDQYLRFLEYSGTVKQTLAAVAAGTYQFRFKLRDDTWRAHPTGNQPIPLNVKVGTTSGGQELLATTTYSAVGEYTATITVAAPGNVYLEFWPSAVLGPFYKFDLDDVSFRDLTPNAYVAAPWKTEDIPEVQYVNETGRDRMVLVHPLYEPRVLSLESDETWLLQTITSVGGVVPLARPTHVTAEWSGSNWPSVVEIWQGRVWMAATPAKKNTFWASKPFSYDFTATDYNALNAGDGFSYDVAVRGEIRWLQGQKVMLCGADEGEYSFSANDGIVYAGNLEIRQESAYGSAKHQAVAIGDQVLYVSQDRRKVRAMAFSLEGGGWFSRDVTFTAEHITQAKVTGIAFARDPFNTVVLMLSDGTLACCNYDRAGELAGWWRKEPVGLAFQSVSVMNRPGGHEVWGVVVVQGETFLARWPLYESGEVHLDCRRTRFSQFITATGTAAFDSATMTVTLSVAHFSQGVGGATPGTIIRISGAEGYGEYIVVSRTDDTHAVVEFRDPEYWQGDIAAIADWGFLTGLVFIGQWTVKGASVGYAMAADTDLLVAVNTETGDILTGLETDGLWVVVPEVVATLYTVGLGYTATAETLPLEGGNPAGSAQGLMVDRPQVALRLNDSGLPLVNGEIAAPDRNLGDPQPSTLRASTTDRYTEDVMADVLGGTRGGILTITQELPIRTEICALYGTARMGKV